MPDIPNPSPGDAADGASPPIDDQLVILWPAVAERLGERRGAFFASARQQAARHGVGADGVATARYLNLCFAFGPGFEDKPDNEWALAILADRRLAPPVRLHQLLRRAVQTLRRRGGDERNLARADAAVLDLLDADRLAADGDVAPLPRAACDIDAVDLRVLDDGWRQQYRQVDGAWQRQPGPPPPPALRIDAGHPAPERVCMLSQSADDGPAARLQLRQIVHGGCDAERHPALRWIDERGQSSWRGHAARAVSWPVAAARQTPPATGLGVALVELTTPAVGLLEAPSCGVRDEGLPIGPLRTQVWCYPAQQWLFTLQRDTSPPLSWPASREAAAAAPLPSRCRIERDGVAVDHRPWLQGLDQALPELLAQGLRRLFEHWQATVQRPTLQATPGMLTGRQALNWGWCEGPGGLADDALMRLLGELDLGCSLALVLGGEIESGGARTAITLRANGSARLQLAVRHERPQDPPLLAALGAAVLRFRFPFEIDVDPVATALGVVCRDAGPCSGAVAGEAGLRPRLSGGSGWQWFIRLSIEPVLVPMTTHDPVLGATRRSVALLPALPLLDWSLG